MLRAVVLAALVALVAAAPAGAAQIRASSGDVTAVVRYVPKGDSEFRGLRLTVTRGGAPAYDRSLTVRGCGQPSCRPGDLRVVDLDADGEPEVLADVYTGGAHCCVIAKLLAWNGTRYATAQQDFGDAGYAVEDLDGDGRPELVSADARFGYAFASYAGSRFPLMVLQVDGPAFTDVTAGFPDQVREDAQAQWTEWLKRRGKPRLEPLGALSAWVADLERLGERDRAQRVLDRALARGWLRELKPWPSGRRYLRELDRFLRRLGYRR